MPDVEMHVEILVINFMSKMSGVEKINYQASIQSLKFLKVNIRIIFLFKTIFHQHLFVLFIFVTTNHSSTLC